MTLYLISITITTEYKRDKKADNENINKSKYTAWLQETTQNTHKIRLKNNR